MRRAGRAVLTLARRRHRVRVRVAACLLLVTAVVVLPAGPSLHAEAADLRAQPAATAAELAEQARIAAAERAVAAQRVAAAVNAGAQARVAVETARRERAERAARDAVRSALPGCDPEAPATFPNGQWPATSLCGLPGGGHSLRPDAAAAYVRLSFAFAAAFGAPPCLTDSYRSYAQQRQVARSKPQLAAPAGTSAHGDGQAVDLCGGAEVYGSPVHLWLREHGPKFGWDNPDWARQDGSRPEPWHWEYTG